MTSFLKSLFLALLLSSCVKNVDNIAPLNKLNDSIRKEFAPDKRVAVYDIELIKAKNKVIISGESDQEDAVELLVASLQKKNFEVVNTVVLLPDSSVGNHKKAIVNNAVANIRSQPKHSAELATQSVLGSPLNVLKIEGDFYLVQTPDKYIAWVDHGGVELMSSEQFENWNNSKKVIYLKTYGSVYENEVDEINTIGDLVLGAILKQIGETDRFYQVEYPDGRRGYVLKNEAQNYQQWQSEVKATEESIELYALSLMGMPYLWGGTSSKGMDCSGFTKTVYRMNGMIIPRDASQQINAGTSVDNELSFKNLEKGDLMFFGKKATDSTKQKVTHVGIWLGNDEGTFVHASGRVRLSSIDPESNYYDAFNKNRYLGSRRYLNAQDPLIQSISAEIELAD